jgi:hypothetical protein
VQSSRPLSPGMFADILECDKIAQERLWSCNLSLRRRSAIDGHCLRAIRYRGERRIHSVATSVILIASRPPFVRSSCVIFVRSNHVLLPLSTPGGVVALQQRPPRHLSLRQHITVANDRSPDRTGYSWADQSRAPS